MPLTVVNMTGKPIAGSPAYGQEKESSEANSAEKIVFVKPHPDGFCFVCTYEENEEVCIGHAEIESPESRTERIIEFCEQNGIKHVRYDFSIFMQEGRDIRERLNACDTDVFLYKPRQNLIDRITTHYDFIKSNIVFDDEPVHPEAYSRFMSVVSEYNGTLAYEYRNEAHLPKEAYNIAMDILSDVARYYRRNS
jgi:hypothetical protein